MTQTSRKATHSWPIGSPCGWFGYGRRMTTKPNEPIEPDVDPAGDPELNPIDPLAPGEDDPGRPPEPIP